jgi:hypothetical protein
MGQGMEGIDFSSHCRFCHLRIVVELFIVFLLNLVGWNFISFKVFSFREGYHRIGAM